MDFKELDFNLIPKVFAQTADGVVQPTFGILNVGSTPGSSASITLTASSTSVKVGDTFTVDIEVKTGAFTINEYHILVDFNILRLQVLDSNASQTGIQIELLDSVFQVAAADNNVSATGRITLIGKTPTGTALSVNRKVARITFQGAGTGATKISSVTGASGSQLINQNGVPITTTLNNLDITVTSASGSTSSSSSSSGSTSSSSSSSSGGSSSGVVPPIIPNTGLAEDILSVMPVIIGVVLVALGALLSRSHPDEDDKK